MNEPPPVPSPPNSPSARSRARSANLALLFGGLSWTICLFFLCIPAVIFGHKALSKAKLHPEKLGRKRAIAGLSFGYLMILLIGLTIAFNKQMAQSNALDDLKKHPELLPPTAVLAKDVPMSASQGNATTLPKGTIVTVLDVIDGRVNVAYEDHAFSLPADATDVISQITANSDKLKNQEIAARKAQAAEDRAARASQAAQEGPQNQVSRASEETEKPKKSRFHLFGSSITKDNYDKIRNGMTKDEVQDILGKPNSMQSEMEVQGLGKLDSWIYTHRGAMVMIGFTGGRVSDKSWTEG